MKMDRRFLFRSIAAIGALLALPKVLFAARPDQAFAATDGEAVIADLFGETPATSNRVQLKIPDIAENGAVVPVTISTDLANVESISIVVDENPTPLAASFELGPKSLPRVSVRIKMGGTSQVRAIIKADGKLYSNTKEVKVTIGGCGG